VVEAVGMGGLARANTGFDTSVFSLRKG